VSLSLPITSINIKAGPLRVDLQAVVLPPLMKCMLPRILIGHSVCINPLRIPTPVDDADFICEASKPAARNSSAANKAAANSWI
jgi:hypothetical protein